MRLSKYRAKPTFVHGFRFASKAEARRYHELLLLGRAGEIRNLEMQPRFPLVVNGVGVGAYIADFRYEERHGNEWASVVEDVKSAATAMLPTYRLKKRMVEAQYGFQIREVR